MPRRNSAAIAAHDSTRVHAAASSSASGRPSTAWQISTMADELLEVVEHEQHPLFAQMIDDLREGVAAAAERDLQFGRQPTGELARRRRILEPDEQRAVRECGCRSVECALRETGLAGATGADYGDQAAVVLRQQCGDPAQLRRAADEVRIERARGCARRRRDAPTCR
ncbi:MAG: hypothetical protein IPI73_29610 [Betaproteobacteria bacterium]|nr:hypothetical protein [Betaproteobacteria bacterium]